jgi:hypothetical protein
VEQGGHSCMHAFWVVVENVRLVVSEGKRGTHFVGQDHKGLLLWLLMNNDRGPYLTHGLRL